MKKIFKKLKELQAKGYYYRMVINPNSIDIKLYLNKHTTSPETNFYVVNSRDDRYNMVMHLEGFINKL